MPWFVALVVLVAGLAAGWVAAWLVHGYEEDADTETAVWVGPACHHCGHELSLAETAPPGWWLRGFRCGGCGTTARVLWPAVQLAVPALSVLMLLVWGARLVLIPFLWLVPVLVVAAAVDIRLLLIPRRVAWWGAAVGAGLIVAVSYAVGSPSAVTSAAIGGAAYFGFLFLVFMIAPAGMGFGDVRLSLLLGLYLGWTHVMMPAVGLLLACLIGIVLGLGVRFATRGEQRHFPFGPGLALGTLIAIAFHGPILERLLTS